MHKRTGSITSPAMKRSALVLTLLLVAAACGDDDTAATTAATTVPTTVATTTTTTTLAESTTTAPAPTTTAATTTTVADGPEGVVFQIASVTFGAGPMVVIYNIGDEGGSLAGHWLCQRPSYAALPEVTLEPGEGIAISLGGNVFLPPPGIQAADDVLNVGGFSATSGELALYSSNAFGSSDAIVSYVEWGGADHGRSSVAVGAGIWEAGAFVETTDATALIQLRSFNDTTPANWEAF